MRACLPDTQKPSLSTPHCGLSLSAGADDSSARPCGGSSAARAESLSTPHGGLPLLAGTEDSSACPGGGSSAAHVGSKPASSSLRLVTAGAAASSAGPCAGFSAVLHDDAGRSFSSALSPTPLPAAVLQFSYEPAAIIARLLVASLCAARTARRC